MKEKKKGGERKGAGRKPAADPKQPVTIFVETSIIESHGGKEGVQFICYGAIYGPVFSAPEFPDPAPSYVKKKFPPSDRRVKQKGVPLPDDHVKFSKVKPVKPDGTVIADLTQPTPALKPQEQPKTNFSINTAPKTLDELKSLCPAELTGFDRSAWIAKERQKYGI